MLIIKIVKVVCFDTLLQVLILKMVSAVVPVCRATNTSDGKGNAEAQSAQRKRGRSECEACVGTPPPVFCTKSRQIIEKKGRESEKERQESSRVRKRKVVKELDEGSGVGSAGFVRDNTRNGATDLDVYQ